MSTDEQRGDASPDHTDNIERDIETEHQNAQQSGAIFDGQQWPETRPVMQEGEQR
ncbi:hypothetical protein ACOZ4N_00765 (plasmid) [Halorientalis pallida]|uniref:hypothetical protein n=1 Tax=Halorientalis pallida TaxID=2479928 RepID=UPI003C6F1A9A